MTDRTHVTLGHGAAGPLRVDVPTLIDTRQVITASSGGGKSYLLRRLIELIAKQVQVIVIDPEGEFNTLREKFDMLLVGAGGEIMPEVRTARQLARKLGELRVSAIIDLYDLGDWDARREFLAPFIDGLMNLPKADYHPIYVPIDEAHNFAPEVAAGAKDSPVANCRRAIRFLMSAGRKRAICGALATQRISKLDKDSLADAKNVFIGGITLDVDQERAGDMLGLGKADRIALRDLEAGEFYAFGPAVGRGVLRFKTDPVITTHPRAGQRHLLEVPPASGAIQKIVAELGDIPRQVQADEDELAAARRQVAEMTRQLRARPVQAPLPMPERVVERVEVTVFRDGEVGRLETAVTQLAMVGQHLAELGQQLATAGGQFQAAAGEVSGQLKAAAARVNVPTPIRTGPIGPKPAPRPAAPLVHIKNDMSAGESRKLPKAERSILTVLAQRGARTKRQVAVQTGYAIKGGGFNNAVSALSAAGFITRNGDSLEITDAGVGALGTYEPLPTGQALLDYWLNQLPKAERAILGVLINGRSALTKEQIAQMTGYEVGGGGFNNALSRLRTLELVTGARELRASEELFD